LGLAAGKGEFGQGRGWDAGAFAGLQAAAVAGRAGGAAAARGGEGAVGAAPDAALPVRGDVDGEVGIGLGGVAGGRGAGAALSEDGGVDGLGAPVADEDGPVVVAALALAEAGAAHGMFGGSGEGE